MVDLGFVVVSVEVSIVRLGDVVDTVVVSVVGETENEEVVGLSVVNGIVVGRLCDCDTAVRSVDVKFLVVETISGIFVNIVDCIIFRVVKKCFW